MTKVTPCPWCGAAAIGTETDSTVLIICGACGKCARMSMQEYVQKRQELFGRVKSVVLRHVYRGARGE